MDEEYIFVFSGFHEWISLLFLFYCCFICEMFCSFSPPVTGSSRPIGLEINPIQTQHICMKYVYECMHI